MKEKVWSCSEYDEAQPEHKTIEKPKPEHQLELAWHKNKNMILEKARMILMSKQVSKYELKFNTIRTSPYKFSNKSRLLGKKLTASIF